MFEKNKYDYPGLYCSSCIGPEFVDITKHKYNGWVNINNNKIIINDSKDTCYCQNGDRCKLCGAKVLYDEEYVQSQLYKMVIPGIDN